jgi:hypothetical protein
MVILAFSTFFSPIWTSVPGGSPTLGDLFLINPNIVVHLLICIFRI